MKVYIMKKSRNGIIKKKIDELILEQQKIKRNGGSSRKVEQALGDIKKKIKKLRDEDNTITY